MPAPEVRVLGPVGLVGDDGPVPLAAKHARVLAALVVANGRARNVDELVEAVWSGAAPASARKLVQVYVSQLRKALPPEIEVITRSRAYALELGDEQLDSARFERLVDEATIASGAGNAALAVSLADQALSLWRGQAFGELAYEDFARAESDRLEELRLVTRERRLEGLLALGRVAEVLSDALALVGEHPYRESVHGLAMTALYLAGRQQEALEHFSAVRARFSDELGLEPGPELQALQRLILQQDPALAPEPTAAPSRGNNLPVPPGPLVGRGHELDELGALLTRRDDRLIVLTGAGGSGKTRLALEAARRAAGSYANGVALVELAPLRDAALVIPTIARTLGIAEPAEDAPIEALGKVLASQELLLLVDNAEHLREAASALAQLAALAPRVTFLVTSRAVLHVSGEHVFPVLPLVEEDAVELFVQRAQLLEPTFQRSDDNDADLRDICRKVDGLPLAIELAAARIRTLPPHRLRERLDERLAVLTGGPRDLPARQQTLRETIEWSVALLSGQERDALARLAIFPGGATLEAVEQVCAADLDTLSVLVDDHLVLRKDALGEPRFGMLETVREYALELLGEDLAEVELALARHYAELADDLQSAGQSGADWSDAVDRLDPEIDNIRVGLAAASRSEDSELQLRLAGGMWRYWWVRGLPAEGVAWIERALAADPAGSPTVLRASALYGGAGLAWVNGDMERAKALAREAIPVAVEAESAWAEGGAHTVLGIIANEEEDFETARYHHRRSVALTEQLGVFPAADKINLGLVEFGDGNTGEAKTLFEEVLDWHRRHENPRGMGFAQLNLGLVHLQEGDHRAARRAFEEGLACFEKIGFRQQAAYGLQGLASCAAAANDYEEAARLLGQARRELDEIGTPWDAFAADFIATTEAEARAALGDDAFEAAFAGP